MLAIRAARLFDGDAREIENALVVSDGGVIVDVTGGAGAAPAFPTHDLGDVTLMPGMIDAHTHLTFDAESDLVGHMLNSHDEELLEQLRRNGRRALAAGITSVRDLGDRNFLAVAAASGHDDTWTGPTTVAAGPPLTSVGGHCHFLGGAVDNTPEAVRAAVHAWADRGVDVIKIMCTGGTVTPGSDPLTAQFSQPVLDQAVAAAHERGLKVTAHAHGADGIRSAVLAGVDGLEHAKFWSPEGISPDQEVIDRIAESGIWVCPTLGALPGAPPPPPPVARRAEQAMRMVSHLHRCGVRLVAGSDAGISRAKPHDVLPYSVEEMGGCGMSTMSVLRAATSLAAQACGLPTKGRLAPGMDADIVAVAGDPTRDLTALRRVTAVYRAGRPVPSQQDGARARV